MVILCESDAEEQNIKRSRAWEAHCPGYSTSGSLFLFSAVRCLLLLFSLSLGGGGGASPDYHNGQSAGPGVGGSPNPQTYVAGSECILTSERLTSQFCVR